MRVNARGGYHRVIGSEDNGGPRLRSRRKGPEAPRAPDFIAVDRKTQLRQRQPRYYHICNRPVRARRVDPCPARRVLPGAGRLREDRDGHCRQQVLVVRHGSTS